MFWALRMPVAQVRSELRPAPLSGFPQDGQDGKEGLRDQVLGDALVAQLHHGEAPQRLVRLGEFGFDGHGA